MPSSLFSKKGNNKVRVLATYILETKKKLIFGKREFIRNNIYLLQRVSPPYFVTM